MILSTGLLLVMASTPLAARAEPKAEFANHCAQGLAMGKMVETNCAINWVEPSSEEKYCFSSESMKAEWAKNPTENEKKARSAFATLGKNHGESGHSKTDHGHDEDEHESH